VLESFVAVFNLFIFDNGSAGGLHLHSLFGLYSVLNNIFNDDIYYVLWFYRLDIYTVEALIILNKNFDVLAGLTAVPLRILNIDPCEIVGITDEKFHIEMSCAKDEHPLNRPLIDVTDWVDHLSKGELKLEEF
jgi:hypothetical protein